jgi:AraC-like DNA-binding protein
VILHRIESGSSLSGLVEVLWYLDTPTGSTKPLAPPHRERVLPTGTFEFVFNLDSDHIRVHELGDPPRPIDLSGAIACGPHSKYFELHHQGAGRVAGVHFKPAGAYPLLRHSAWTFANRHADLAHILGPGAASSLREQLASHMTSQGAFAQLESTLAQAIDPGKQFAPVVSSFLAMLERDPFCNPIATLTREFAITHKGLIDVFKRQVGLTPKKLSRVLRFQKVLTLVGSDVNWADLALRCGYFDQAHFARDFRDFSGFSAGAYSVRAGKNPNHIPAP